MRCVVVLTALLVTPPVATAQIADRVAEVEDGVVRFGYDVRPGVEICEQGIRVGDRHTWWTYRGRGDEVPRGCRSGFAEVELEVRRGVVRDVEIVRDPDARVRGAVDLGEVSATEAAAFFFSLPHGGATNDGAREAMFPAMIADVHEGWRTLLEVARDRAVHSGVRKQALFWIGQEAADAATEGLAGVARDEAEDQEVRNAAIFALSQRPDDEALPVLMEVARGADHAETRRTAMFWLAQSDDERVVAFFEDILLGRMR
jgi:hypothetical protein